MFFWQTVPRNEKNTKPLANSAKKCRNVFLHPTPLQHFSALPNKPLFSLSPRSTGAHGHYRSIQGACHSWWQLYNRGAIGYVAMLKSAGLCWRFQRGMPWNWCNSPCFIWKVWLFGKSLWSPMKETYIFQPSLATVMVGGGLTHVIPSPCCSLGSLQSACHRKNRRLKPTQIPARL